MIIGMCGAARSGKDTVAGFLADLWQAQNPNGKVHFIKISAPLKAYLRDLFGWTEEHTDGALKDVPDTRYPDEGKIHVFTRSKDDGSIFVCHCGAEVHASATLKREPGECVTYLTPRKAMQWLGGEFTEATFPAIYALRAAREAAEWCWRPDHLAIVTDCRYMRDIQAVKNAGGVVIQVHRDGVGLSGQAAEHMGEVARTTKKFQSLVDHHIDNDGSLEELRLAVALTFAKLVKPSPRECELAMLQTAEWGSAPEEVRDLALKESAQGVPTGIAYISGHGWHVVQSSGQGPYLIWP